MKIKLSAFSLILGLALISRQVRAEDEPAAIQPSTDAPSAAETIEPPPDPGSWVHDASEPFGATGGSCGLDGTGCGGEGCGDCSCCEPCTPPWMHLCSVYGDFLYLRPRSAEVDFAVPIDGPIVQPPTGNPIQVGRTTNVDPGYEPGFRVGFWSALSPCSSIGGSYTRFESNTFNSVSTDAPDVLRSLVSHPSSQSAATDFLSANAGYSLDFDFADADFRRIFLHGDTWAINYLLGGRYARLSEDFEAHFFNNGTESVQNCIDFDGGGIRFGLDGQRFAANCGLMAYCRGTASFVAGEFRAHYFQGQSFDPSVVDTSWKAGRIVPILDLEIGAGWTSPKQHVRLSAGYMVSSWFNTVKVQDFINAVQNNNFNELSNALTFDGLTARAEFRW